MRVLFFTETGGYSGAERALLTLAAGLKSERVDVGVVLPSRLAQFADDCRTLGIRTWAEDLRPKQAYPAPFILPWLDAHNRRVLAPILREFSPDIVVLNMPDPEECVSAMLAVRSAGVPTVGWIHLPQALEDRGVRLGRLRTWLCSKMLPFFNSFLVPGDGLPEVLSSAYGIPVARIAALPNAVRARGVITVSERDSARAAFELTDEKCVLALVGRIHFASKRQDLLAEALRQLGDRGTRFHVLVAGDGPDYDELYRRSTQSKASWQFLGWRDDVRTVFAAADHLVMPSHCEGLALTALEAADAGLPMLLTPVGANAATFPQSWLVDESVEAWTNALARIHEPRLPSALSWWKDHHETFTLEAMTRRFLEIARSLTVSL